MPVKTITALRDNPLYRDIVSGQASLWISEGLNEAQAAMVLGLPWANIWNFDEALDVATYWAGREHGRELVLAGDIQDQTDNLQSHSFIRLYQLVGATNLPPVVRKLKLDHLKIQAANLGGTLFLVGTAITSEDIEILTSITEHLNLVVVTDDAPATNSAQKTIFHWAGGLQSFVTAYQATSAPVGNRPVVDLKDAIGVEVPDDLLSQLGPDWRLLTRAETGRVDITQEGFDRFLSGEPEWPIFAASGAKIRDVAMLGSQTGSAKVQLDQEILRIAEDLDRSQIDPRNALRQLIIFVEPGSGATTLLRQAAVRVAQAGFPTLISNPLPKDLVPRSVGNFVGSIQELWWVNRSGKGKGTGRIPCVIFLDADAEELNDQARLPRILSGIGREVLLVRAVQRSRDEAKGARGVYHLTSDIEEGELLEIGDHLREFCQRYKLSQIPGREEWQSFHEGMRTVARYSAGAGSTELEELPHLFLVGLQPFIAERISDVNSLEQYYFQRWASIPNENVRSAIYTVAAAGVFGIAIPYNALRRLPRSRSSPQN